MLVFSRKLGEQVMLPSLDLKLTILSIEGRRVRVGISAPESVAVHRQEVWHGAGNPSPGVSPTRDTDTRCNQPVMGRHLTIELDQQPETELTGN